MADKLDCDTPLKVAVIGAGISGLAAAASLVEKGFHVYLLEASDYIGGRLKQTEPFPGFPPIDLGGDFIHGSNNIIHQLAEENGWKVKQGYGCDGDLPKSTCIYTDGKLYSVHDTDHADVYAAFKAWDDIIMIGFNSVQKEGSDIKSPEGTRILNEEIDEEGKQRNHDQIAGISLYSWLSAKGFNQNVMNIMESRYCQTHGDTLTTFGVLETAVSEVQWDYGAGNYRLEGSYSLLLSHFINKCAKVDKRLNWPVKEIKWTDKTADQSNQTSAVNIASEHGESLQVNYAVVTVPLTILKEEDIIFSPPLPIPKQRAIKSIYMGTALKVVCRFKKPFWRETLLVVCPVNFLHQVWTYSRDPNQDGEECHVAVGFETAVAAAHKVHLTEDVVCQRFVQQLDEMFGTNEDPKPASTNLLSFVYYHWSKHPYIRGGYSSHTVNTLEMRHHLAEPVGGRLFFAGEATHLRTSGTVHSALETGIRAADEVWQACGGNIP